MTSILPPIIAENQGFYYAVIMNIKITVGDTVLEAELFDTELGRKIGQMLPVEARPNRWGDEIYFSIPLGYSIKNAVEEVEVGDLAYWPPGKAFCIFYGRTPVSSGEKPRAASGVEVFGKITGDAELLKQETGSTVSVRPA
jgi:uncharacterized protein